MELEISDLLIVRVTMLCFNLIHAHFENTFNRKVRKMSWAFSGKRNPECWWNVARFLQWRARYTIELERDIKLHSSYERYICIYVYDTHGTRNHALHSLPWRANINIYDDYDGIEKQYHDNNDKGKKTFAISKHGPNTCLFLCLTYYTHTHKRTHKYNIRTV